MAHGPVVATFAIDANIMGRGASDICIPFILRITCDATVMSLKRQAYHVKMEGNAKNFRNFMCERLKSVAFDKQRTT